MSKRSWIYGKGPKDNDLVEELDAAQGNADDRILRRFTTLEFAVGEGRTISDDVSKRVLGDIQRDVETLPENRALHWLAELERIGAIQKAPAKKVDVKADTKENTGGVK